MLDPSIYVRLDQIKFAPGAEVWQGQDKTGDKKQGQVKGPLTGESYTQVSKSAEQAIRPKRESRHNYTNVVQVMNVLRTVPLPGYLFNPVKVIQ